MHARRNILLIALLASTLVAEGALAAQASHGEANAVAAPSLARKLGAANFGGVLKSMTLLSVSTTPTATIVARVDLAPVATDVKPVAQVPFRFRLPPPRA